MDFNVTLLVFGILLLLVGLAGKVKAKELEVGTSSTPVRAVLSLMGIVLTVLSFNPEMPRTMLSRWAEQTDEESPGTPKEGLEEDLATDEESPGTPQEGLEEDLVTDEESPGTPQEGLEEDLAKYGQPYRIRNHHGAGSYLDTCGGAECAPGTRYKVVTHSSRDRAGKRTAEWLLVSARNERREGTPVRIGDLLYIKNMYGEGSFLDTCGGAKCSQGTRYNVVTDSSRDRAGKRTAEWLLVSAGNEEKEGTPVHLGELLHIKNMYGAGSFLDTCGGAECAPGTRYNVVTDSSPDRTGDDTATWSFER